MLHSEGCVNVLLAIAKMLWIQHCYGVAWV